MNLLKMVSKQQIIDAAVELCPPLKCLVDKHDPDGGKPVGTIDPGENYARADGSRLVVFYCKRCKLLYSP